MASIFLDEYMGGFPTPFEALEVTGVGKGEARTAFNYLSRIFCAALVYSPHT